MNNRRSTKDFCFTASFNAISWCSKKQSIIALSSCEAEYVVATMTTQEYLWLRRLIQEMVTTLNQSIQINCDSEVQ